MLHYFSKKLFDYFLSSKFGNIFASQENLSFGNCAFVIGPSGRVSQSTTIFPIVRGCPNFEGTHALRMDERTDVS